MQAGTPTLRPLNLTDLLDETFALYRRNFALFAGVVAVLEVPLGAVNMIAAGSTPTQFVTSPTQPGGHVNFDPNALAQLVIVRGSTSVLAFLVAIIITGALAQAIAFRYLGRQISVGEAYTSLGVGTFGRLFAVTIATGVLGFIGILLAVVVVAGGTYLLAQIAPVLAVLFALGSAGVVLFGGFYAGFRAVTFVSQAIVLEPTSIFGSFRRSWDLVGGNWWRVFGIYVLLAVMVGVISGGVAGVAAALTSASHGTAGQVVSAGLTSAVGIVVQPVQLGAMTLLYYDLRIRKEGFDLELAMQDMEKAPSA